MSTLTNTLGLNLLTPGLVMLCVGCSQGSVDGYGDLLLNSDHFIRCDIISTPTKKSINSIQLTS